MAKKREAQCSYCGSRDEARHSEGCPAVIGTPEAVKEWQRGYEYGFQDNYVSYWWHHPDRTWALGYHFGKEEIERLIDVAHQRNYSLDL